MSAAARRTRAVLPTPKQGQLVECRGSTWRFLGSERGFWHLELVKDGAQFAEVPVRVWALPELEAATIRVLDSDEALAPPPSDAQKAKAKLYKPLLQARRNHSLQDVADSQAPKTALHCAIEHKEWQFAPWQRLAESLPFPRLLIADDVGLGKTTEAAIILTELARRRRAERILVVAPQHLVEKWQDELYERFGLAFEIYDRETRQRLSERGVRNPWEVVERVIVSRDFVKRWENLKALEQVTWDVVVIDECHHFVRDKSEAPTRIRELAEKIVYRSPGLLLLSATPFTGSPEEFHSLLRLIDPKFHDPKLASKWDPSNPYLIRRLKADVKSQGEVMHDRVIEAVHVKESDLSALERKTLDAVGNVLLERRAAGDQETWDRLLEETARKRLSSSWRAFKETISGNQRIAGWFDDAVREAVGKLDATHDSAKLKALGGLVKRILAEDPKDKAVVFTEALSTQEAIAEYLTAVYGLATGAVATIRGDTDRGTRLDVEDRFANPESDLRVLIATDTIAEGKDLQHACNHLIHFELPWSLVRIEQRNGRIDRLGQRRVPHIYTLVLDTPATPDQKVLARLQDKLEQARVALGSVSPIVAQFDVLTAEQLASEESSGAVSKEVDHVRSETEAFGLGQTSLTALSATPALDDSDFEARRLNIKLMLDTLGGSLAPYGQAPHQFLLGLPDGWDLPGIRELGEADPTLEAPWRVTFHPRAFLDYEQYRREHGDGKNPLRFLSPVHPVIVQIESRFRAKLAEQGYPVFVVDGSAHDEVVLVELTARSPSSRIMSQRLAAFELKGSREIPLDVLSRDFTGVEAQASLPSSARWKGLHEALAKASATFARDLQRDYQRRAVSYLAEQAAVPSDCPGAAERARWLEDLWSVDPSQAQFQILALLISRR